MEQIKTIILNKKEYKITETAYFLIHDYLDYIEKKETNKDILSDIEIQISIILDMELDAKGKYKVVEQKELEEVISILRENRNIKYTPPRKISYRKNRRKTCNNKKKNKIGRNGFKRVLSKNVLGGVCAGIGEYLNIDPVLVRILFIISAFFFRGLIIPVYIILWIVIPSDKQILRV